MYISHSAGSDGKYSLRPTTGPSKITWR